MTTDAGDEALRAHLTDWVAAERDRRSRAGRMSATWHRQMAAESMVFSGLLRDLLDSGTKATVITAAGRSHSGAVAAVGSDFVAIRCDRRTVAVALPEITGVGLAGSARSLGPSSDRRPDGSEPALIDVLAELAIDRHPVKYVLRGSTDLRSGWLEAVGEDVITIAPDQPPGTTLVVPVGGLSEAWLSV